MAGLSVAIAADVLVAALLSPAGTSARLLQLGSLGIFQPIITGEALAEAEQHAREGVAGRMVTEGELLAFRAALAELPRPAGQAGELVCTGTGGVTPAELIERLLAET
jgi:hypothetical protein